MCVCMYVCVYATWTLTLTAIKLRRSFSSKRDLM